jgi:hypothetical protein
MFERLLEVCMQKPPSLAKEFAAGVLAGVAASWIMNRFQTWLSNAVSVDGQRSAQKGPPEHGAGACLQARGLDQGKDNTGERLANFLSYYALFLLTAHRQPLYRQTPRVSLAH